MWKLTKTDIKCTVRGPEKTRHRRHDHIVFKEFAEPIQKWKMMRDVFTVLADLIKRSFDCLAMASIFSRSSDCNVAIPSWKWMGQIQKRLPRSKSSLVTTLSTTSNRFVSWGMVFFKKPRRCSEPEEDAHDRQLETGLVFPQSRLCYEASIRQEPRDIPLLRRTWISEFADGGLSKLSANADRRNTSEAFPGGPTKDIHKPIQDTFSSAKEEYDNEDTELEGLKVSEMDANRSKMGKRRLRSSGERRGDDRAAEEV